MRNIFNKDMRFLIIAEEEYALVLKETSCPDPPQVAALNFYRDIAIERVNGNK